MAGKMSQTQRSVMNPTLNADRIQAAIAEDPERGRAEWLGEWRQGVSSFLDPDLVDVCTRREPLILPRHDGLFYAAGVDPFGGGADEFAWCVCHREGERGFVDLLNARGRQGRRPFDLDEAVKACVADLPDAVGLEVGGDKYAGAWSPRHSRNTVWPTAMPSVRSPNSTSNSFPS